MRAVFLVAAALLAAGCGSSTAGTNESSAKDPQLTISAIPDQDPEQLARLYPLVANDLGRRLGVRVAYRPVTDYSASVTAFKTGDLDLVWFGGLTGVQALHQVPGARALAQRDIDARFHSVFIASKDSEIPPVSTVAGLAALRGKRFTFGSESSTSGRLMPEYFLREAGLDEKDFRGQAGFSGSHDKTIALVSSGSYDAGALNEQVWKERLGSGEIDRSKVRVIFRTPPYHDYFWTARPDLDRKFGAGFTDRLQKALVSLRDPKVLELFGAQRFIPVSGRDHDQVRAIAKQLRLLDAAGA
jgi:phosphonate transport system substrate-binding protein